MRKIFLAIFAVIFLSLITYQPKIVISSQNFTLATVNATENMPLTIKFVHSVQKTPVIEELELKNGEFLLRRTKYKSQGVGLPFDINDGTFHRDKDWFIFDIANSHFWSSEPARVLNLQSFWTEKPTNFIKFSPSVRKSLSKPSKSVKILR